MKFIKTILIISSIFLSTAYCFADTVTVQTGDVLTCDVLTGYICLSTPYQNLFFKTDYVASIIADSSVPDRYTLKTINNDTFSGSPLNKELVVKTQDDPNEKLSADNIKKAILDASGETKEKESTIFFMQNGDRFSGKLVTDKLTVQTDQMDLTTEVKDIKRIVFKTPGTKLAEIYLNDGSMLEGEIEKDILHIAPDSTPDINVCITQCQSIQFNALKYIKKTITPQEYSDPKTNLPQYMSMFSGVSTDITNGGKSCAAIATTQTMAEATAGTTAGAAAGTMGANDEDSKISEIHFDTNQSDIKPIFIKELDKIASVLKEAPSLKVLVKGHTDNVASAEYNQTLSLKRAYSVARYLEDAGVANDRISISGYGLTQPIASNKTEEGRAMNRRVEIELIK